MTINEIAEMMSSVLRGVNAIISKKTPIPIAHMHGLRRFIFLRFIPTTPFLPVSSLLYVERRNLVNTSLFTGQAE